MAMRIRLSDNPSTAATLQAARAQRNRILADEAEQVRLQQAAAQATQRIAHFRTVATQNRHRLVECDGIESCGACGMHLRAAATFRCMGH